MSTVAVSVSVVLARARALGVRVVPVERDVIDVRPARPVENVMRALRKRRYEVRAELDRERRGVADREREARQRQDAADPVLVLLSRSPMSAQALGDVLGWGPVEVAVALGRLQARGLARLVQAAGVWVSVQPGQ